MAGHDGRLAAKVEVLRAVPLLASCTKKELAMVAQIAAEQEFPAGRAICHQGETGVGLHVILEGATKLQVDGRTRRRLGPGTVLGEVTLLDQGERPATVVAETRVRALTIPAWEFRSLLKQHPDFALRVLEALCRRVRAADRSLTL